MCTFNPQIDTGSGYWDALLFVLVFILVAIIVYIIRSMGVAGAKKVEHRGEPFYFGNPVPETARVSASNVYWGFVKAMEKYYRPVQGEHTGNVNDYVSWMVLTMGAVLLLLVFL